MKKAKYFLILVTASAIIGMFSGCVDDNGIVETFEWWQWGRISNQRFIKVVNDTSSAITVYFQELAAYKENDSDGVRGGTIRKSINITDDPNDLRYEVLNMSTDPNVDSGKIGHSNLICLWASERSISYNNM